jgi:AcrR family transcriptional regulator
MAPPKGKTASAANSLTSTRPDGRRLRTAESRRKVVTALLDCVRDGDFDPSAEAVALRAGVGLRTVFRLFSDKEGLYREMSEVVRAQLAELTRAPLKGETWRERLDEVMKRRFAAFEQVMPYRRAALAHAHHSNVIQANNQAMQSAMRQALAAVTPPEVLADRSTFEAIDLILSIDSWIRLRLDQGLKAPQARSTVQRAIAALLAGAQTP